MAEAAARIGRSTRCLYNWRSKGEGPPYYTIGGRVTYRAADIDAWIEGQRVESPNE